MDPSFKNQEPLLVTKNKPEKVESSRRVLKQRRYNSNMRLSFVIIGIPAKVSKEYLIECIEKFGKTRFFQYSRDPGYNLDNPIGEAYLTFEKSSISNQEIEQNSVRIYQNNYSFIPAEEFLQSIRNRIFVKKIPKEISKKQLIELFTRYGQIKQLIIPGSNPYYCERGFMTLTMNSSKSVDNILQDESIRFLNKEIEITRFNPFMISKLLDSDSSNQKSFVKKKKSEKNKKQPCLSDQKKQKSHHFKPKHTIKSFELPQNQRHGKKLSSNFIQSDIFSMENLNDSRYFNGRS